MWNLKDRVRVDFSEVPKNQRQCEVGAVLKTYIRMPDTSFEKTMITIKFDRNYIKEKFRLSTGIPIIVLEMTDKRITAE